MTTPASRPEKVKVTVLSLDVDALPILHALSPTLKAYGRTVSRLLFEERVRLEMRAERDVAFREIARLYGPEPAKEEAVSEK